MRAKFKVKCLNYNAIDGVVDVLDLQFHEIKRGTKCELCYGKIEKSKNLFAIRIVDSKNKERFFHVLCFLRKVEKGYLEGILFPLDYGRCDACEGEIGSDEGVWLVGEHATIPIHKVCLIASIYKKMRMKLPKEIEDKLVALQI